MSSSGRTSPVAVSIARVAADGSGTMGISLPEIMAGPAIGSIITPSLNQLINQFDFGSVATGSQVAAPPCRLQGDFPGQGQVPSGQPATTHYPHVWAAGPP